MSFEDKTLVCKDCKQDFSFTSGEQEFYSERGFENEPARCRECRDVKKREREVMAGGTQRELFETSCHDCGKTTIIPFQPQYERPIYCRDCFFTQKLRLKKAQ